MAFTFRVPQIPMPAKSFRKHLPIYLSAILALVMTMASVQDYLLAKLMGQGFYLSESLLFKSFLLPFIPISFLLEMLFARTGMLRPFRILFIPICAAIHLLAYAMIVNVISRIALDHTYGTLDVLQRATAEDAYKYLLAYGLLTLLPRTIPAKVVSQPYYAPQVLIQNGKNSYLLEVAGIHWISADDPYTALHTPSKRHLSSMSLKTILEKLDPKSFVRIHRSTIIAIRQVQSLRSRLNGDYDVTLKCGTVLRASRRYSKQLRELISSHSA